MGRSCVLVACITSSSTALLGLGSPSKQALYGLRVLEVKEYGRTRRTSAEILVVFQMRTTQLCRAVWLLKPCVSLSTDGKYAITQEREKDGTAEAEPSFFTKIIAAGSSAPKHNHQDLYIGDPTDRCHSENLHPKAVRPASCIRLAHGGSP